ELPQKEKRKKTRAASSSSSPAPKSHTAPATPPESGSTSRPPPSRGSLADPSPSFVRGAAGGPAALSGDAGGWSGRRQRRSPGTGGWRPPYWTPSVAKRELRSAGRRRRRPCTMVRGCRAAAGTLFSPTSPVYWRFPPFYKARHDNYITHKFLTEPGRVLRPAR
uniref:Uncharacterized protein n=1 Tax=Aegilops tauschii subsp. strangulata TaxID=200361 RepID=A0A453QGY9_AEGTS